jgi:hypothetical protein
MTSAWAGLLGKAGRRLALGLAVLSDFMVLFVVNAHLRRKKVIFVKIFVDIS